MCPTRQTYRMRHTRKSTRKVFEICRGHQDHRPTPLSRTRSLLIPLGEQQARRAANRIIPVTPQCRILPMSSETSHLHSIAGAKVATRSARERLHTASESLHGQNDRAARISREASRADTDAFAGGADTSEPTRKSWSHPPRGNRGTMAR